MKNYIGIDLGGTNIVAAVVNENYDILSKASIKTSCPRPDTEILSDMAMAAESAVKEAGLTLNDIECVGVGSPGTANGETGCIEYANNLGFLNTPMSDFLNKQLGKKVYIENDANAAALGEYLAGAARGFKSSAAITLGTGVGGGVIIDGRMLRGSNFAGAEMGHIVIEYNGRPCTCGRNGCFEAYASATGLINITREIMEQNKDSLMWELCDNKLSNVSGRTAFIAVKKNDKAGKAVCDKYIGYLACGVTNLVNIFQPEVVCIGGGISGEGEVLLAPLRELVYAENYAKHSPKKPLLKTAALGNNAGIIGAAMLHTLK